MDKLDLIYDLVKSTNDKVTALDTKLDGVQTQVAKHEETLSFGKKLVGVVITAIVTLAGALVKASYFK